MSTKTTTMVRAFVTCSHCQCEYPRKAPRCPGCGNFNRPPRNASRPVTCHRCGQTLPGKSNVCAGCGFAN